MKKTYFIPLSSLLSTVLFAAGTPAPKNSDLAWVDEQVAAIKPARVGLKKTELRFVKSPFIYLKKTKKQTVQKTKTIRRVYKPKRVTATTNEKVVQKHYTGKLELEAIINKSVLINGRWYKQGQLVHGYKISEVRLKTVVLTRGSKTLVLSTKSYHGTLKFNNN